MVKLTEDKKFGIGIIMYMMAITLGQSLSGRGDKVVIEDYIKNQGREKDIKQLKLFDI